MQQRTTSQGEHSRQPAPRTGDTEGRHARADGSGAVKEDERGTQEPADQTGHRREGEPRTSPHQPMPRTTQWCYVGVIIMFFRLKPSNLTLRGLYTHTYGVDSVATKSFIDE